MKKVVYIVIGLCAILASCAKEIEQPLADNSGKSEQVTPRNSSIPASITAEYSEPAEEESAQANVAPSTKTSYPGGVFNWVLNDEVAVYYVDDATTPTKQGWYAYKATTLGTGNATAEFTYVDDPSQEDKETAMTGWTCAGIAVYPSRAAQPSTSFSTGNIDSGYENTVYVKVPQQVSGEASDIMLIGTTTAPTVSTSFKFRTAMAVLKVTVTNIPAQAKQLRLYTSDKENYPLDGDFLLHKDGDNYCIKSSDYRKYNNGVTHSANDYIYATISTDVAIASRDFYFNIPVGSYPKGAFSLKLEDANGNPLLEKTLNKAFDFNRNDLVNTPALANEWVTLGDAKFHDMFYLDNVKLDSWNWATTALQRNVSDNNKYRLVKPYQAYSAANSYTPLFTPDDYLYFTVNPENDLVSFERHLTGQTFSSKQYVISHTDKSGGHMYTQAYSKVVSKDGSGNPLCVQLAPYYLYSDFSDGYSRTDKDGMVMILFPDFDDSCTLSSDNNAEAETVTIKAVGPNISKIKVGISSSSASAAMTTIKTTDFTSLPGTADAATGVELSDVTNTGRYYIAVKGYDTGGREVYRNTSSIYHITTANAESLVGTYTHDYMVGTGNTYSPDADANGDNTLTLAVSDDVFKGNIMLTKFAGYCFDVSESTHTTLVSDFSQFTDGSPIYGKYDGSIVRFDNLDEQVFYKDAGGYSHYIKPSDRDYIRLYFNSDGYSSGISHDLVVWEPDICNSYYNNGFGQDLRFDSYVAHNSTSLAKMVPLTKTMLSTNTSKGEDGSGDYGGMAALVDKRYNTYWHSNYSGSTQFGEYGIYIQIDLGTEKTLQDFKLRFRTRNGVSHGLPTKYYVAASNVADFSSSVYKTVERTITGTDSKLFQEVVAADAEYRYIRLCITEMNHVYGGSTAISLVNTTENGQHYTHLAEIQLWEN